jgi:hypothetical protein
LWMYWPLLSGTSWMSHSGTLQLLSLGKFKMFPRCSWLEHLNHTTQDTVNVLVIFCAGNTAIKLAQNILNELEMYWVGMGWAHRPFPCDVFVMYWVRTPPLAPSDSSQEPRGV